MTLSQPNDVDAPPRRSVSFRDARIAFSAFKPSLKVNIKEIDDNSNTTPRLSLNIEVEVYMLVLMDNPVPDNRCRHLRNCTVQAQLRSAPPSFRGHFMWWQFFLLAGTDLRFRIYGSLLNVVTTQVCVLHRFYISVHNCRTSKTPIWGSLCRWILRKSTTRTTMLNIQEPSGMIAIVKRVSSFLSSTFAQSIPDLLRRSLFFEWHQTSRKGLCSVRSKQR